VGQLPLDHKHRIPIHLQLLEQDSKVRGGDNLRPLQRRVEVEPEPAEPPDGEPVLPQIENIRLPKCGITTNGLDLLGANGNHGESEHRQGHAHNLNREESRVIHVPGAFRDELGQLTGVASLRDEPLLSLIRLPGKVSQLNCCVDRVLQQGVDAVLGTQSTVLLFPPHMSMNQHWGRAAARDRVSPP